MPSRVQVSISIWGKNAALADQLQLRQPFQQRRADLRPLADQDQSLGLVQAISELVDVLDVVVPDRHVMPGKLAKAVQRPQRVEIVVEDGDLHDFPLLFSPWRTSGYFTANNSTSNISVALGGMTPPAPRAP